MTDIVERLRRWHIITGDRLQLDAADEIERLRNRAERLESIIRNLRLDPDLLVAR